MIKYADATSFYEGLGGNQNTRRKHTSPTWLSQTISHFDTNNGAQGERPARYYNWASWTAIFVC